MKRLLCLFLPALTLEKIAKLTKNRYVSRFCSTFLTFCVDLQGNYSLGFSMAVASYHGVRSSEVELGVRYFQPILWPCIHQPEVGRVSVIVGLEDETRVKKKKNIRKSEELRNRNVQAVCTYVGPVKLNCILNVYRFLSTHVLFSLTFYTREFYR